MNVVIVRGYGAVQKLGINRDIIFLRFSGEGLCGINKVIGSSQVIVTVESLNDMEIVKEIRSLFPIESYMIFKSSVIHKKAYLPEEYFSQ